MGGRSKALRPPPSRSRAPEEADALFVHGRDKKKDEQRSSKPAVAAAAPAGEVESSSSSSNKPRNLMVTDATSPLQLAWTGRFRLRHCITVHQTAQQDTWPGGAVWDLGWCLGQLLIGIGMTVASPSSSSSGTTAITTTTTTTTHQGKSTNRRIQVPARVSQALHAAEREGGCYHRRLVDGGALVLELGCGVGLTGLVAAAALQARAVVLTDLPVVIDQVTQPNVVRNTTEKKIQKNSSSSGGGGSSVVRVIHNGNNNQVLAMPLCWGNEKDEQAVAAVLESLATAKQQPTCTKGRPRKKKGASTTAPTITSSYISRSSTRKPGMPDLVVIGDVAYQHAPGAPSHFDALVSTLLQFVDEHTLVLFGTRIRMPASVDLLALLLEYLEPVVEPAVTVDEIEPAAFANVKHNMSIHFLRKKKGDAANVGTNTNTVGEIDG